MYKTITKYFLQRAKSHVVPLAKSLLTLLMVCVASYGYAQSTPSANENGEKPTVGKIYKIRSVMVYRSGGNRVVHRNRYLRASNFENSSESMSAVLASEAPDFSTMRGDEVNRYYWVLRQNSKGMYFTNYGGKGYIGCAEGVEYDSNGNVIEGKTSYNTMGCTEDADCNVPTFLDSSRMTNLHMAWSLR